MFSKDFFKEAKYRMLDLDSNGYDKDGYDEYGYDRNGYNRKHFNKDGYFRNGDRYDFDGIDSDGYDQDGYNMFLIDKEGYKKNGFHEFTKLHRNGTKLDNDGYDVNGYNKEGYNKRGFNRKGVNKNGTMFDKNGFDRHGYDKDGYNEKGYKRGDVKNHKGINCTSFLNREGYSFFGYDKDGYDRAGFDINGLDKTGEYFSFIEDYISKNTKIKIDKQNLFIYRLGVKDILVGLYNTKKYITLDKFEDVIISFDKSVDRFVECVLLYSNVENNKYILRGKKGKLRAIEEKRLFNLEEVKKLRRACDELFKFKKNEIVDIIFDFEILVYKWLEKNNNE